LTHEVAYRTTYCPTYWSTYRPTYTDRCLSPVEYIFSFDAGGVNQTYHSYDTSDGTAVLLDTFAVAETVKGLATDGTFVFAGNISGDCRQYSWDGSDMVEVLNANLGSGGNTPEGIIVDPKNAKRLYTAGTGAFGDGIAYTSYETAATFSYAEIDQEEPTGDTWNFIADFRFNGETEGYGSVMAAYAVSGENLIAYDSDGSTLTEYTGVAFHTSVDFIAGWDRDTGIMISTGGFTNVKIAKIDPSTKTATIIGTSNAITGTASSAAFSNGFIIIAEGDAKFRSYSLSGTTLTLKDTITRLGELPPNYAKTSPFTDHCYFSNGADVKVIKCDDAGIMTLTTWVRAIAVDNFSFWGSPLIVT